MNATHHPTPTRGYRSTLWLALCCLLGVGTALGQVPEAFEAAAQAYAQGNFAETDRLSREALARHPGDPFGLNLLAVALDGQKKYAEAEAAYLRALRGEQSAALLNNMANHCLA